MPGAQLIVTGGRLMDLDAMASAIAYAEFLHLFSSPALPAYSLAYQKECSFVFRSFQIEPPLKIDYFRGDEKVILVDCSDPDFLPPGLSPVNIVEVIDHRSLNRAAEFINARLHLEMTGAAATIIARKFISGKSPISLASAALLYSAIVSNTVNFKASLTTDKDIQSADWLSRKFTLPPDYIQRLFADKSCFDQPLEMIFDNFLASAVYGGKKIGIIQLEIVSVEEFVNRHYQAIMENIALFKRKLSFSFLFLSLIDVERAFNIFVVADQSSAFLVSRALGVNFDGSLARRPGVIMRKQIWPLIQTALAI